VRRYRPFIAGAAVLAVVVPMILWIHYRAVHVVSRNAQVKGYITNVGAQLDGVVTSVEVDAGQRVQAGQIMARFENHHLQVAVQRAQSRFDKASRELEVERLAIEQEGRRLSSRVTEAAARAAAAKSQVKAAQNQADDAKTKYQLRQSMAQDGLITPEELRSADVTRRTAEALGETAKAEQTAAEAARDLAKVEFDGLHVRQQHVVVLESEIAAYRAERDLAQADLDAAVIRAPAAGWVVRRIAEAGSSVVVGQPIIALWIGNDVWVEAWIDEDDLAKVAVGNRAQVTVKSFPDRAFTGTVESIGVSTDYELPETAVPQPRNARMRASPVICVRVRLAEFDGLFPGLSAVVGIRKGKHAASADPGREQETAPVAGRR
jgi:membrane fusion protein (multidrug efflux system)